MQAPHSESSQPSFEPVSPTGPRTRVEQALVRLELDRIGLAVDVQGRGVSHLDGSVKRGAGGDGDGGGAVAGARDGGDDRAPRDDARPSRGGSRASRGLSLIGADAVGGRGAGGRRPRRGRRCCRPARASASGTRRIVGASAVIATRASAIDVALEPHDGGRADDGDLHLAPVLEPHVRAAGAGRDRRQRDGGQQLARLGGRPPGPGPQLVERDVAGARRRPRRRVTTPPRQSSGPPVSIAGDAFMTLPPIVPVRAGGAGADDRRRVRERGIALGDDGVGGERRRARRARRRAGRRRCRARAARRARGSRRSRRASAWRPSARRRRGRSRPRPAARRTASASSASSSEPAAT